MYVACMRKMYVGEVVECTTTTEYISAQLVRLGIVLEMPGAALGQCVQGASRPGVVARAYTIGGCRATAVIAMRREGQLT